MDQYCSLILMSLFSPAIESLRDLQRACALDKVRKRLGVSRVSLGSLSESVAIFDPALLKEIAIELGRTIRSKPKSQFAAVGQPITAVDGTVIATVKRVAELSWTPKAKHLSACRLHTHFELLSGKAVRNGVGGQRSLEGESADTSERTEVRMTAVSVRREGVGSPSPRTTWIGLPCICRAEQDCPEGRSERPATGHGQSRAWRHRRKPRPRGAGSVAPRLRKPSARGTLRTPARPPSWPILAQNYFPRGVERFAPPPGANRSSDWSDSLHPPLPQGSRGSWPHE